MKVLIFGAGGIGSLIGGFLARTGHDVSLLGRAWHLDAVRQNGLSISGIWGDYRIKAFDLFHSPEEILSEGKEFDLIFLTVKAYDTKAAARGLTVLMRPGTAVVSVQNGLGNARALAEFVKPEALILGVAMIGVEIEPGRIKVTVAGEHPLTLGPAGKTSVKNPVEIAHLLSQAKISSVSVADAQTAIWSKAIYNCALNAICTLHDFKYAQILEDSAARAQMKEVVRECYAVGKRAGIPLAPLDAESFIDLLEKKMIPQTASHFPSMLHDLRKGRRLDIESLNGEISRLGKEYGIPTPQNDILVHQILQKTGQSRLI